MAEQKNKVAATMRSLQTRAYFQRLVREFREASREATELERLQEYLIEWAAHQRPIDQARRAQTGSVLAAYMKSDSPTASELLGASDAWALEVISASIDDLLKLPRGSEMRAALHVKYLNMGISREAGRPISVLRHGRLQRISLEEVGRLSDAAEIALIPIVKARRLPL